MISKTLWRLIGSVGLGAVAASLSCGGVGATRTVATLPGDGDANTDKPRATIEDRPTDQPWGDADKLISLPDLATADALTLPATETFKLKNGLEVILVSDRTAPVASFQLAIKAGRERAKRETVGLARLTAVLTTRGTRARSADAIVKAIEGASGDLTADASYEATLLSCSALSDHADTCMTVLADIAANATFPAAAVDELRTRLRDSAAQRALDAGSLAAAHFQNLLWGADHPRGWPSSPRSIGAIKRADILAWYRAYYRPNNAILAVSGDFDAKAMRAAIEKTFSRWQRANVAPLAELAAPSQDGIRVRVVDKPDERVAQIRLGHLGVSDGDDDYLATAIVNAALGGLPINSTLERALGGLGDSFSVAAESTLDNNRTRGSWVVSAAAPAQDSVRVAQLARDAIAALRKDGLSAEETQRAASFVAGSYATRFQSVSDVAGAVLAARLHDQEVGDVASFPPRVTAVTAASATAAAKKHLSADALVVVFVGPAAQIIPALDKAGWKYEVSSYIDPVAPWDRDAAEAEGRKILADALKAKGGEKALRELKSFRWTGTSIISADKRTANVEKQFVAPNQLRLEMEIPSEKLTIITVMSGNSGWAAQKSAQAGSRVIDFPASEVEAGKAQIWRDQDLVLLRHLEEGSDVALVDEITVGKKPAWAIRIISPQRRYSAVLYVEKGTNLLSGMTYQERGEQGVVVAEERYSNYKRVSGIQFAQQRITRTGALDLTTDIDKIVVNEPIDASVFVKPAK